MLPDRKISSVFLAVSMVLLACGGGDDDALPTGPYDEIPLGQSLQFEGVTGAVHVARDEFGIAHIQAENGHDLFFALGYVMAHDRLPQMDILRRFGAGTVAELFGIDESALESDLEMRIHQMKPTAELALAELRQSTDPDDADLVVALEAFADGVNTYVTDVNAGKWTIDSRLLASFDPERFQPWEPADSLVLGRFQAFALSWTAPFEVDVTDIYQTATEVFDEADPSANPELADRAGAGADFTRLVPVDRVATIDGLPNVDTDRGTRSNDLSGSGGSARTAPAPLAPPAPPATAAARPRVPRHLLRAARRTFREKALGPHGLMVPNAGSNNWSVGPQHTGGKALLAGDPHLNLPNPSIFYPVHLVIPGELDVEGSTFPGIPGVLHGHNGNVAWASTVVYHDVNDIYLEDIVPCPGGSGDCTLHGDETVPIERWEETINLGSLGTVFDTRTVTYERVPHHGQLIPEIVDGAIVPRTGDQALSVRYTGHSVTHEVRFLWKLNRARSIPEAFAALTHFQYGGQNWMFVDKDNNIGWSTHVDVPLRDPAAYTWHPTDAPDGLSPAFVLPGKGGAEWQGLMSPRYIPHAYNPPTGYLVTANSDPVGATFDGIPHNEPVVDGRPLFLASAAYAPGLRSARIDRRLQALIAGGDPITLEDMASLQTDSYSNTGERFVPHIETATAAIDGDTHADVTAWIASLDAARVQRLRDAAARLGAWTFATPPAVRGAPTAAEIDDSVATTLFNVWAHYFMGRALGDEYARLDWDVYDTDKDLTVRPLLALLEAPATLHTGLAPETGEPILCDDLDTAEIESCTLLVLQALDDALTWLASDDAFGAPEMSLWRWGRLHTLTLEPLFPETALNVPPPNDPDPDLRNGYPRPGDNWVVNRADCGWNDTDFTHADGPAQRMLVEVSDGRTHARLALPGGTIYDPSSPHFRDLADNYYTTNTYFDVPFTTEEIVSHGEDRWLIRGK